MSFVNFSNHSAKYWSDDQLNAAKEYGDIIDILFPAVSPEMDENELQALADACVEAILKESPVAVMVQGEFTLCFSVIEKLKEKGIVCVAACYKREAMVTTQADGTTRRESFYSFVRFREYA
jgi:hypothetical protein